MKEPQREEIYLIKTKSLVEFLWGIVFSTACVKPCPDLFFSWKVIESLNWFRHGLFQFLYFHRTQSKQNFWQTLVDRKLQVRWQRSFWQTSGLSVSNWYAVRCWDNFGFFVYVNSMVINNWFFWFLLPSKKHAFNSTPSLPSRSKIILSVILELDLQSRGNCLLSYKESI